MRQNDLRPWKTPNANSVDTDWPVWSVMADIFCTCIKPHIDNATLKRVLDVLCEKEVLCI